MDGQKFDELIRSICTTRLTRLSALRGLVAGAAAAVTGSALVSEGEAAKKKGHSKKKGKKKGAKKGASRSADTGGGGGGGGGSRLSAQSFTCVTGAVGTPGTNQENCGSENKVDLPTQPVPNTCYPITNICGCESQACIGADGVSVDIKPVVGKLPCTFTSVIVKGGKTSLVYTFPAGTICATGLLPPKNCGQGGNQCGLSHFQVCGTGCCVPLKCKTDGGTVQCGTNVDNNCNGLITCTCPSDNKECTTDTCSTSTPGVVGTCSYFDICPGTNTNLCKENCQCTGTNPGACSCTDVVCPTVDPAGSGCPLVGCDPDKGCDYTCPPPPPPPPVCFHSDPDDTDGIDQANCQDACREATKPGGCQETCGQGACNTQTICPLPSQGQEHRQCVANACNPACWSCVSGQATLDPNCPA